MEASNIKVGGGVFTSASLAGGGSALAAVVNDTSPQLGGNLDLNSKTINGIGNIDIVGSVTATSYIVSSSVTHMTQSFSSGSTIFGNTPADDTHQFTGSVFISGSGAEGVGGLTVSTGDGVLFKVGEDIITGHTGTFNGLTIDGKISSSGVIHTGTHFPNVDNTQNLGKGNIRWHDIFFGGDITGATTSTGSFGRL